MNGADPPRVADDTHAPRALAIVGLGLIGTSIALAARRRWKTVRILGIDRCAGATGHPLVADACDDTSSDLESARTADVIVLALPVSAIIAHLPQLLRIAGTGALITDTGSTKRAVMAAAHGLGSAAFVGGHPMAGRAEPGAGAACADLFDARAWFLVEGKSSREQRERARGFVNGLGAWPIPVEAEWHDRVLAAVSHLPQVVASALMKIAGEAAGEEDLVWSGRGLKDTTRLASSAASTWSSILESNVDHVRPLLLKLSEELRDIAEQLDQPDAIERLFDTANGWKTKLGP